MAESVKVTAPTTTRVVQVRTRAPSTTGTDGKSVYQLWLEAGNVGTFEQFLATQAAIHFRGTVATIGDLPDDAVEGDAYVVDGHLWVFVLLRDVDGATLVDEDGAPLGEWADFGEWTGGGGALDPDIIGGDVANLTDPVDIYGGDVADLP